MKESNVLHMTDVTGEPAPVKHVNLLKQKTTPDDDVDRKIVQKSGPRSTS